MWLETESGFDYGYVRVRIRARTISNRAYNNHKPKFSPAAVSKIARMVAELIFGLSMPF